MGFLNLSRFYGSVFFPRFQVAPEQSDKNNQENPKKLSSMHFARTFI